MSNQRRRPRGSGAHVVPLREPALELLGLADGGELALHLDDALLGELLGLVDHLLQRLRGIDGTSGLPMDVRQNPISVAT